MVADPGRGTCRPAPAARRTHRGQGGRADPADRLRSRPADHVRDRLADRGCGRGPAQLRQCGVRRPVDRARRELRRPARAGGGRRRDRRLERTAALGVSEGGSGTRGGVHRRGQAERGGAAECVRHGRPGGRGRDSCGCLQPRQRHRPRGRRGDCLTPADRPGHPDRFGACRQPGDGAGLSVRDPGRPRARRQVSQPHSR